MEPQQQDALVRLGRAGWELVSVTTLDNGWLLLAFKRPWTRLKATARIEVVPVVVEVEVAVPRSKPA